MRSSQVMDLVKSSQVIFVWGRLTHVDQGDKLVMESSQVNHGVKLIMESS